MPGNLTFGYTFPEMKAEGRKPQIFRGISDFYMKPSIDFHLDILLLSLQKDYYPEDHW